MARRAASVDPCLICMSLPCQCAKPARAKPTTRRMASPDSGDKTVLPTVEEPTEPVTTQQSMLDRMRARAAQSSSPVRIGEIIQPEPVRARPTAASAELRKLDPDDALEVSAIRALMTHFQVEGEAVERWKDYLEKEPSRAERAAAWRASRQEP